MISTPRLYLYSATIRHLKADLSGNKALAIALGRPIDDAWPPELYDTDAINHWLSKLAEDPSCQKWGLYYFYDRLAGKVIGAGGFKGKPDANGMVEIGYSILPAFQGKGIATEATWGLTRSAFIDGGVALVTAETLPALTASQKVLEKCGFISTGAGSEAGAVRYEVKWDKFPVKLFS